MPENGRICYNGLQVFVRKRKKVWCLLLKIKAWLEEQRKEMTTLVVDDALRQKYLFRWLNMLLAIVAFGMSVINVFTREFTLMVSTLLFCVLCVLNFMLVEKFPRSQRGCHICFAMEALALLGFFFISGIPDGFSALWICLIPSFALLIFGPRNGSVFCLVALVMMVFLFWLPAGRGLLQYRYSQTFMLRFPFLYISVYLISLFMEYVRGKTQKQLAESEEKFRHMYRHDALTGLFNRYGFDELMKEALADESVGRLAMMMIDIDDFKQVNDTYGHAADDRVLQRIARVLSTSFCEDSSYCRWGGEEFLVAMWCEHDPRQVAETIRRKVEDTVILYEEQEIRVTVSVGVYVARREKQLYMDRLQSEADKCLYQAKAAGKNRVVVVDGIL